MLRLQWHQIISLNSANVTWRHPTFKPSDTFLKFVIKMILVAINAINNCPTPLRLQIRLKPITKDRLHKCACLADNTWKWHTTALRDFQFDVPSGPACDWSHQDWSHATDPVKQQLIIDPKGRCRVLVLEPTANYGEAEAYAIAKSSRAGTVAPGQFTQCQPIRGSKM